ncbi:MAG: fused MFS/spermidine synthase [Rubripirellula sp.]|nr:fused MFS/spermidine synthase [Rubripirellula sp.]
MSFVFFFANAFLAAFLLFQIQPLAGKLIMPTYGGATSVWTACLLFFQVTLLAGYGYAFVLATVCKPRTQIVIHSMLLIGAVVITEKHAWKQVLSFDIPVIDVLLLLSVNIGFSIVLLAATSPLLQTWFHSVHPSTSPYRMYAFSNAGSLLGLISYPFLIEPVFMLGQQVQGWAWGVVLYSILTIPVLWQVAKATRTSGNADANDTRPASKKPSTVQWVWWVSLAACGVSLLLSVTNELSRNIAPVPLMWVLPLMLYLLTFILTFEYEKSYHRGAYSTVYIVLILGLSMRLFFSAMILEVMMLLAVIFVSCMICHGELVRSKPDAKYLTLFYLSISFGGALGGILISVVAPLLFNGYYEFGLSFVTCCMIVLLAYRIDRWATLTEEDRRISKRSTAITFSFVVLALGAIVLFASSSASRGKVIKKRSFFGCVMVRRLNLPTPRLELIHAGTVHGLQAIGEDQKRLPTAYYGPGSGIGLALEYYKNRNREKGINLAAVGLGVGTLSTYLSDGDSIRFYEIDPMIIDLANTEFTFLSDARKRGVNVSTVAGDGRISLQRETEAANQEPYDLIVVDAFSGDSIPSHLLTRECFEIYWSLLSQDGTIAIHTSNNFIDLEPVIRSQQVHQNVEALVVRDLPDNDFELQSHWILLTKNMRMATSENVLKFRNAWEDEDNMIEWTDDYSSLLRILKFW